MSKPPALSAGERIILARMRILASGGHCWASPEMISRANFSDGQVVTIAETCRRIVSLVGKGFIMAFRRAPRATYGHAFVLTEQPFERIVPPCLRIADERKAA